MNKSVMTTLERLNLTVEEIVADYRLVYRSRQVSLIGRQEALAGKAGFGIFGDGKEVPQVALAKVFHKGDFRSGYYRDQTLMFALDVCTIEAFFAQLYANADLKAEPASGGRQMNAHFASRSLDENGGWRDLTNMYNTAADMSCTGAQMPRIAGLAYASKLYRQLETLQAYPQFSNQGNEVTFGTIGNATCAEGVFWETVNAIGVLKVPVVLSIWDDGYGISVPNEFQVTKQDIYAILQGFRRENGGEAGFDLYQVKGWDYLALVEVYQQAAALARQEHVPAIIHVTELTQPQGHSSSGSHERYKSQERLAWEAAHDCLPRMRAWLVETGLADEEQLAVIEAEEQAQVRAIQRRAWEAATAPLRQEAAEAGQLIQALADSAGRQAQLQDLGRQIVEEKSPNRKQIMVAVQDALLATIDEESPARQALIAWQQEQLTRNRRRFGSHLYSESPQAALRVPAVAPVYSPNSASIPGHEVLNACFDAMLAREPHFIAFGQDLGRLGGVNLGFAGLQEKYGPLRVADTGIRETTIIGQAIGAAMRGLRPLAEIQYLDYLLYCLQIMSDDVASLHYRTRGGQKAPVIVRTRGHRQVGIWHAGSPLAGIINLLRGMHVLVPRNMVQAAGFYNTLLLSDDPALVIETLNAYRRKERLPDNLAEFTVPLGVPELLRPGDDITLVTYGACCPIALEAAERLSRLAIELEVIDVQTLLPFDTGGRILESLKKTGRIIFIDEDVPGGATAYMMQQVIEEQGGYYWLDSEPCTLTAQAHRPAYGVDGDYFSKPNVQDVMALAYELMNEADPAHYPPFS
jgi:pyruvate/2-oxoglutarate/acetoin dehydrogenase E1 component/TPP-dependent pyruvate/acetoin dehydrogenase alpha subunit